MERGHVLPDRVKVPVQIDAAAVMRLREQLDVADQGERGPGRGVQPELRRGGYQRRHSGSPTTLHPAGHLLFPLPYVEQKHLYLLVLNTTRRRRSRALRILRGKRPLKAQTVNCQEMFQTLLI